MKNLINTRKNDEDNRIYVTSPYNQDFICGVKQIGGKWSSGTKEWSVPSDNQEMLSKLLLKVYGFDPNGSSEMIRVTFKAEDFDKKEDGIKVGEVLIAKRYSRDSAVSMSEGAYVIEGNFKSSGGSAKYPRVEPDEDVVISSLIPKQVYDNLDDDQKEKLTIVEEKGKKERLEEEKDRLLRRLAEIEEELKSL